MITNVVEMRINIFQP